MELWIRSQDKETLMIAQHLDIYTIGDGTPEYYIEECGVDLGKYKSKERALEVLDTIENILSYNQRKTTKYSYTNSGRLEESSLFEYIVYRMPEE